MMRIDILTLFPLMFDGVFTESIIKRAREEKKVEIIEAGACLDHMHMLVVFPRI